MSACSVSCQLCLTRSLTAQDVPRARPSKRPLARRVALGLSLSCVVSLTSISNIALPCPCYCFACWVYDGGALLCDPELSGFLCFSQVISRRTSCFRLGISACCCRPCTRVVYPISCCHLPRSDLCQVAPRRVDESEWVSTCSFDRRFFTSDAGRSTWHDSALQVASPRLPGLLAFPLPCAAAKTGNVHHSQPLAFAADRALPALPCFHTSASAASASRFVPSTTDIYHSCPFPLRGDLEGARALFASGQGDGGPSD